MSGGDTPDWDAGTYDRVADPQEEWGREVLARLDLKGDETVLDAGCGSGRVTRLICERLPDGKVIGVVFGAALDDSETGFVLTGAQVKPTLDAAPTLTRPVDTGSCAA